jgi:hypothetical protein
LAVAKEFRLQSLLAIFKAFWREKVRILPALQPGPDSLFVSVCSTLFALLN